MVSAPASTASSTAYWIRGRSSTGSISLATTLVAGRKRVPSPATGNTTLRNRATSSPLPLGTEPINLGCRVASVATLQGHHVRTLRRVTRFPAVGRQQRAHAVAQRVLVERGHCFRCARQLRHHHRTRLLPRRGLEDLRMRGAVVVLERMEQLLEQFFAGPQPGVQDRDVAPGLLAGETDHLFGQIAD